MSEDKPPPKPLAVTASWTEAWFFLSLLAVLFWGVAGIAGAATSFFAHRAVATKLSRPLATAAALAIGVATIAATEALLPR